MRTGYLLLFITLLLWIPLFASAQWPTSPDERLYIGNGIVTAIASDGDGGAFIAYVHSYGNESNCYFQRVDREGFPQYSSPIHLDSGVGLMVFDFDVVTDGLGGAIFGVLELCYEEPNWYGRLSLFRYDHEGQNVYWNITVNAGGVVPEYDYFFLEADSVGGAYIGYIGMGTTRIQHFGPNGERLWGDEGIHIDPHGMAWPEPSDFTIGVDRNNCFATLRGDTLYAYKFTPEGEAVWGEGIMIPDLGNDPVLSSDGTGGFVELYREYVNYHHELIASRIDSDGNATWGNEGVYIGDILFGKAVLCHYPYTYVLWQRDGWSNNAQLEKLDYQGNRIWPESLSLFSEVESQGDLHMLDTGSSGLVFFGSQSHPGTESWMVTQKYSYDGEKLWDDDGVFLSSRGLAGLSLDLTTNHAEGGIYSWYEVDPLYGAIICAAMVNAYGELGIVGIRPDPEPVPLHASCRLYPCFPNPFNASTTIRFALTMASEVKLGIYNLLGRQVAMLEEGFRNPGSYTTSFNQNDMAAGMYFIRLSTPQSLEVVKMVVVR
jgi:hypothetical protein